MTSLAPGLSGLSLSSKNNKPAEQKSRAEQEATSEQRRRPTTQPKPSDKMNPPTLLPIVGLLLFGADALPEPFHLSDLQRMKREHKLTVTQQEDASAADDDVETLFFDQRLDHFGETDATFRQRYFYTSRYVHKNEIEVTTQPSRSTAAFLCVGGEGPSLDTSVLTNSVHCTGDMIGLADRLFNENWDVHLYAIEHRYYGASVPIIKSDAQPFTEHLRRGDDGSADDNHDENQFDYTYLSSRQAVKDIVEFVKSNEALTHSEQQMDVEDAAASNTNNNTWILFGGSYPGMLSAWARLLHPETIHGAVANSAPVQPQLDFYQYYDHVALDLVDERVGGSEECKRIFVEAHEQVVAVFDEVSVQSDNEKDPDGSSDESKDPLEEVATLFNVCGGADMLRASRRNMEAFVGDGLIRVPSQSNDPSCEGHLCNIKGVSLLYAVEGEEKISLNFVVLTLLFAFSPFNARYVTRLLKNTCQIPIIHQWRYLPTSRRSKMAYCAKKLITTN